MNTSRTSNYTSSRSATRGMITMLIMVVVMMYTMIMTTTATTANPTTIYTLGVIVATDANRSTDLSCARYAAMAAMALQDINTGVIELNPRLPSHVNISLTIRTSYGHPVIAFTEAENAMRTEDAVGIVGPFLSEESTGVATLGSSFKIPIFSPSASTSDLSDKDRFPYFMRGTHVDIEVGDPLLALFAHMKWKKVCYVGTNDAHGHTLLNHLAAATLHTDTTIIGSLFLPAFNINTVDYAKAAFQSLLKVDCRIFVLHTVPTYATDAVQAAQLLHILDNPKYVIVGTPDWMGSTASLTGDDLRGMLGIVPMVHHTQHFESLALRMTTQYATQLQYNRLALDPNEANWYDVVWYYAQAIARLIDQGINVTGENLLPMLQSMNHTFTGATGLFTFDENYDRRQQFDIVNFQTNNVSSYQRVMMYDPETASLAFYPSMSFVYAGAAATVARDGVTFLAGDSIQPTLDGSITTLAFVIGLVSCWCSLILVEQVMYASEKQQRWWTWSVACALTQGGPGVWALHMIGLCGFSWPIDTPLRYSPDYAMVALVISLVCTSLAFYAGLFGWRRNKYVQDRTSSYQSPQQSGQPATGKQAAAIVKKGKAVAVTPAKKYDADPTQTMTTINSQSEEGISISHKRRRLIRALAADHSVWGQIKVLRYRLNWWFALAAVLLSCATFAAHTMITLALPPVFGAENSATMIIAFVIVGTPLNMVLFAMVFHFFPTTGVRGLVAVGIHCVNFMSHMMYIHGMTFTYTPSAEDHAGWWEVKEVILAVAISTAAICFVLLAVNVSRMKLSRNALDLIVVRFKKELASTVAQVQAEKEKEAAGRREREKLWRMLETINMCRPLHRDHALATVLADYEFSDNGGTALQPLLNPNSNYTPKESHVITVTTGGATLPGTIPTPTAAAAASAASSPTLAPTAATSNATISARNSSHSPELHGRTTGGAPPSSHDVLAAIDPTTVMAQGEPLRLPKARAASALAIYQQLCSTIQLNGPTPDSVLREVKLDHVLHHPVTLELFKDAMIRDHCAENLMLYLDIWRYKQTADAQLRGMLSREIYDTFITRGARYEVNISDTMRKQLEAKFAYRPGSLSPASVEFAAMPPELFQPIEDELMKLILVNNWPRFTGTPTFNLCAMILGRPQFRIRGTASSRADSPVIGTTNITTRHIAPSTAIGSSYSPKGSTAATTFVSRGRGSSPRNAAMIRVGARDNSPGTDNDDLMSTTQAPSTMLSSPAAVTRQGSTLQINTLGFATGTNNGPTGAPTNRMAFTTSPRVGGAITASPKAGVAHTLGITPPLSTRASVGNSFFQSLPLPSAAPPPNATVAPAPSLASSSAASLAATTSSAAAAAGPLPSPIVVPATPTTPAPFTTMSNGPMTTTSNGGGITPMPPIPPPTTLSTPPVVARSLSLAPQPPLSPYV